MRALAITLLLATTAAARADPAQEPHWSGGEHLTGEWGGVRTALEDHGLVVDIVYAAELFGAESRAASETGWKLLSHVDAAVTVDTEKLGLWPGGKLYVLGQRGDGHGINEIVPSATQISNLEAAPYQQLTEYFVEQSLAGDRIVLRVGKQDANRDFGTPRYGGNFLNNNFGMFPTTPLPSYPTTGLGASAVVKPVDWLAVKAGVYEGNPMVGSFHFGDAFGSGATATAIGGLAVTRHYGPTDRDEGTTSAGVWHQTGDLADVTDPAVTHRGDTGFFVQHDEHIYLHPADADDPRGLNVILRFGWAQADRTDLSRFLDGSAAWHGIGPRHDDTVGLGVGYFTDAQSVVGFEDFVEAFYKARFTSFISLQIDLEAYQHPGADGANAFLAGARVKFKL